MIKEEYKERVIDQKIEQYLKAFKAICIEGPKWCGKTWTAAYHSKSSIYIGDSSGNFQNRNLAELDPSLVLQGEQPRLIDEWQEVPLLWDAVRNKVDQNVNVGQFIMTGSATPNHKGILHSGAGRIAKLRMRPMSLYESGDSSGMVSLLDICEGRATSVMSNEVHLETLIHLIVRGGWPASVNLPSDVASLLPSQYLQAIIDDDLYRIDGIRRDSIKMNLLLRSLARNECTTASNKTLIKDMKALEDGQIDTETISNYLDVLTRLFIIENQAPFSSNIRSSVRVKQAEKRHFCDPSLACALLKATPSKLLQDLETLGFLFESLCERDLRIYAESFGGNLYHYQDYKNREIDAVVELSDGRWCAFEIKLGANQIDAAAQSLLTIRDEIAADPKGVPPIALCVICGLSNAAYLREDGVYVVPITALKP